MRRTSICAVRSVRNLLPSFLRGKTAETSTSGDPSKRSSEQKEAMSRLVQQVRLDVPRASQPALRPPGDVEDLDEILDTRLEMDTIRARGFLKYTYNYTPEKNVNELVVSEVRSVLEKLGRQEDAATLRFNEDTDLKFKTLSAVGSRLAHYPLSGDLVNLKSVKDLVEFYRKPVKNITEYQELARSEQAPSNVKLFEQPVRFHPEDKEAFHGGVTAFPGMGGRVFTQRNKRLLRQFRPKEEWFEYEESNFDYSRPDKDMPWDPEVAKKMDRYPDRRYSLKTKTFHYRNGSAVKEVESI